MKKNIFSILFLLVLPALLLLFVMATYDDPEGFGIGRKLQEIFGVKTPEIVDFAGEAPPLDQFYVKEQLDRELTVNTYWHSSTIFMIKRAHRYFPVIEPILKENNIPDDFKYLPLVESGMLNVVSPSGAAGFWQFLEGTARDYHLTVNKEVDERYHLAKATQAACFYLRDAFDKYNSWTMAAASYNAGMNKMNSVVLKQKSLNYYDLNLNDETSRYIYRILAIKEILENPGKYGYELDESDLYHPQNTYQVTVDSTVTDLAQFALDRGINYKLLKEFNPWLIDNKLTIEGNKSYSITLPRN